jgi:hypothetical protein
MLTASARRNAQRHLSAYGETGEHQFGQTYELPQASMAEEETPPEYLEQLRRESCSRIMDEVRFYNKKNQLVGHAIWYTEPYMVRRWNDEQERYEYVTRVPKDKRKH